MMNRFNGGSTASSGDAGSRLKAAILVCAIAAATGCSTTARRKVETSATRPATGSVFESKIDPAVSRTEHRSRTERPSPPADQGAKLHFDLGKALEAREEYETAIAEYRQAIQALDASSRRTGLKAANDLRARAERGTATSLERLGRFDQAEVHYRLAFKIAPRDAAIWNDYGFGKALQERWADSEKALRTAVKLDPNNPRYQTNLGLTLASEGKTDEALKVLTKAGGAAWARHNIGIALVKQGKLFEARRRLANALEIAPDQFETRAALKQVDDAIARAGILPQLPETVVADSSTRRTSASKSIRSAAKPR